MNSRPMKVTVIQLLSKGIAPYTDVCIRGKVKNVLKNIKNVS